LLKRFGDDPFLGENAESRVLLGVTVISNAPRIAELAGSVGLDTVWIEVEHGTAGFVEVELLCMAAEAGGAIPTVRIPDHQRTHVLRAVEAGARILVVPMINTAEQARLIVEHGKFPPLGKRGYNTRSRGVGYGLKPPLEAFAEANARTHFFPQIETLEAVKNLEAICSVEGIAGVFIGPGDLTSDAGKPGSFKDPEMIDLVVSCIQRARGLGKHAGILVVPGPMLDAAREAGCDLIFGGGDLADLANAWKTLRDKMGV
jgi:4-hydroxy-2-oxoheptanedioate aldolase